MTYITLIIFFYYYAPRAPGRSTLFVSAAAFCSEQSTKRKVVGRPPDLPNGLIVGIA